uniref:PHD-type domain-containing protein n=1 Tax=Romanomermis culicivorax TaxID=13658 RepID=A0A915JPZ9_ROMCU
MNDSQIPSGDENEDVYKLPEMRPKPMDLQTLISNNLSNLEAEEDEDIIGSLSDVDDKALLNVTLKSKDPKRTFWECQVDKTVNRMLKCDAQVEDICRIWYHPECENISEIYFSLKNNRKKPENKFYWECTHCFIRHYF